MTMSPAVDAIMLEIVLPTASAHGPPAIGVAAGASRPSRAGLGGVVEVDVVAYVDGRPIARGTVSLMIGFCGCPEPLLLEDEYDPGLHVHWVSDELRHALARLSCDSSAHLRAYLRSLEWAAVDAVCPDYPWAELALQERAERGFIMFRTWLRLTPSERHTFGAMSQTSAQRALRGRR